jgi:hypothetical protein
MPSARLRSAPCREDAGFDRSTRRTCTAPRTSKPSIPADPAAERFVGDRSASTPRGVHVCACVLHGATVQPTPRHDGTVLSTPISQHAEPPSGHLLRIGRTPRRRPVERRSSPSGDPRGARPNRVGADPSTIVQYCSVRGDMYVTLGRHACRPCPVSRIIAPYDRSPTAQGGTTGSKHQRRHSMHSFPDPRHEDPIDADHRPVYRRVRENPSREIEPLT